jgi:hypothetical protein
MKVEYGRILISSLRRASRFRQSQREKLLKKRRFDHEKLERERLLCLSHISAFHINIMRNGETCKMI